MKPPILTAKTTDFRNHGESRFRDPGKMPAAEEQDHHQEAGRDHVRVLAQEEHAELQRAVLGVVAADQFLLAFGQVERQPVALGEGADQEQQETPAAGARRSRPTMADPVTWLDDPLQVQRAGRCSTTPRIDMPIGIS